MTTKGQRNPNSKVILTASQAGENSQAKGLENTIVSSIVTDLISKRNNGRKLQKYYHRLQHKFDIGYKEIKDKKKSLVH